MTGSLPLFPCGVPCPAGDDRCRLPEGHGGPHAATYLGVKVEWFKPKAKPRPPEGT